MLPQWLKDYLSFHKTERSGIIVLVSFLVALIAFNLYQRVFWKSDWEEIQLKNGPLIIKFQEEVDSVAESKQATKPWAPKTRKLFRFDPNKLDSAGWVSLGFSPKQSAAILKYRKSGAVFRRPQDMKKLFVVDEVKYAELEPFIAIEAIPESNKQQQFADYSSPKEEVITPILIELNSADTNQLKQLYGIGSSFAKRIVKYRELLGGYMAKEQLLEVYGMDSARYLPIKENLLVDTIVRTRVNINNADFKTFLRHPYLNKNQVKAIVNYRKQHGPFNSIQELNDIHLLKGEPYRKIAPYFTVQ